MNIEDLKTEIKKLDEAIADLNFDMEFAIEFRELMVKECNFLTFCQSGKYPSD